VQFVFALLQPNLVIVGHREHREPTVVFEIHEAVSALTNVSIDSSQRVGYRQDGWPRKWVEAERVKVDSSHTIICYEVKLVIVSGVLYVFLTSHSCRRVIRGVDEVVRVD
jgi:hypothetical protein